MSDQELDLLFLARKGREMRSYKASEGIAGHASSARQSGTHMTSIGIASGSLKAPVHQEQPQSLHMYIVLLQMSAERYSSTCKPVPWTKP